MKKHSIACSLAFTMMVLATTFLTMSCAGETQINPQLKQVTKLSIATKKIDLPKGSVTRFGGPVLAFDADGNGMTDLVWKDMDGNLFLLEGEATKLSVADKLSIFGREDVGEHWFVATKLFRPDEKNRYILASSSKELVLLDTANLKLKEVQSDHETTFTISGICGDFVIFGPDIDGDGREEIVDNGDVYEWDGKRFSPSNTLPHIGAHSHETAFADIDGDGSDEVISNAREHSLEQLKVSRLRNGAWLKVPVTTDETQTNEVYPLGDIDGDGNSEIATVVTGEAAVGMAVYDYQSGHLVKVYSGSFTKPWRGRQHPEQIKSVSCRDLDGDGKNEILITTEDIIPDAAQGNSYFVAYRYMLFTWEHDKLVELASGDVINPRVIAGDSSFLIVSAVPDKENGPYDIEDVLKNENLQATEIAYR